MSGRLVVNKAIQLVRTELAGGPAASDLEATLAEVDEKFALLYHALALDAGLSTDAAVKRAVAVLLQFASVQLADDLADGECRCLPQPERTGAGAQWLLQHLYHLAVTDLAVGDEVLADAARDFVQVGAAQQIEVRTSRWNLDGARAAAIGLNARQHRAYFRIVLAGTPVAAAAPAWGYDFGFALHVVGDRLKGDRRWSELEVPARALLVADAKAAVGRIIESKLPSLRRRAEWFAAVLDLD